LVAHPASPCDCVRALQVQTRVAESQTLALVYSLTADLSRLRLPPPRESRRADQLWKHTCFEAFVRSPAGEYYELNFSPSGEWSVYRFSSYRTDMRASDSLGAPVTALRRKGERLELEVTFSVRALTSPVHLALAAVIEAQDGTLSYWALRHPPGRPDFHHPDSFALGIET
jgi:hypothetical protein